MNDRSCVEEENRLASLVALEALGLLSKRISDGVRMHLRVCGACRMEYRELRSISDVFETDARRGDPAGPASPKSLKSLILHAVRAARSPIHQTRRNAHSINDCAFVECASGARWAVAGESGVTLVYRVIGPLASECPLNVRYGATKFGIVLEGSVTMIYADRIRQRLCVWDTYTVPAGVMHLEEFHERTRLFEVYAANNFEDEECDRRQAEGGGTR
jgi:hypothetical protein